MAITKDRTNLILGIVFVVVGILVLTGDLALGWLLYVGGIVLIVVGILMAIKKMAGGTLLGLVAIGVGIILVVPEWFPSTEAWRMIGRIIHFALGILLIVLGLLRILGKKSS